MRKVHRTKTLNDSSFRSWLKKLQRRGVVSLQVVFVLPILVITTIAVVQFGMQVVARETISASATSGARAAARGGDVREVTNAVANALATDKIGTSERGHTVIVTEVYGEKPKRTGNTNVECRLPRMKLKPREVRVTVSVRGGRRGSVRIPNWFGALGRPLSPRRIQSSALLTVE